MDQWAELKCKIRILLDTGEISWISLETNGPSLHPNSRLRVTQGWITPLAKQHDIVFGAKPQAPMTLILGLLWDKNKQFKYEFCVGLQSHTHSENNLPKNSLNRLFRPQLSDELLKPEKEHKQFFSSTYQRCRQITSKTHEHWNQYKLGRPISVGQKIFLENHAQDLMKLKNWNNYESDRSQ